MKSRVLRLKFHRAMLYVEVEAVKEPGETLEGLFLTYRSMLKEDARSVPFLIQKHRVYGSREVLEAVIDLAGSGLKPVYWDLTVESRKNGKRKSQPVSIGQVRNLIRFPLYDGKYCEAKSGCFFHPYITPEKTLGFQFRERTPYDTRGFRIREGLTLFLYYITKPYWNKQKIYLIYEKFCATAQDNAYYFFCYCMEHQAEKRLGGRIYYVMDKNSPDFQKVAAYKERVIPFMSLRHRLYLLAARLLVSTDTRKHSYAWHYRMSLLDRFIRKKKLLFLQHGVTALKRDDAVFGKGKHGGCDLFIVTSDYEKNIIKENFGYQEDEIAVTGFARWDVLEDRSKDSRMILVMPTWRAWLEDVSHESFVESDYYRKYRELLCSPKLQEMLEELDLQLCFYIHPKFREYLKDFEVSGGRVRMVPFGEEPLNQLLMQCRLLVTDYSSVCWDVYYQGKPVIFYQFDLTQYLAVHGSYLDMEKELFGHRETSVEGLLGRIRQYAAADFCLEEDAAEKLNRYFPYRDKQNCERIMEQMERRNL